MFRVVFVTPNVIGPVNQPMTLWKKPRMNSQKIRHCNLQSPLIYLVALVLAITVLPWAARANYTSTVAGTTATMTGDSDSDTVVISQSGGLLMHNRFSAGDPGFNSNFDFNSSLAGDQTMAASSANTVIVNGGAGQDILIIHGNLGTLNNLRSTPTAFGSGTVIDDNDGTIPTITFTGMEELQIQVDPSDGDDRNETIDVAGGEAGGLQVKDTINGVVYARVEVFNVASAIVNGGDGANIFTHDASVFVPTVTYFGNSVNDTLTYFASPGQPVVVNLPGNITQNGTRV